MHQSLSLPFLVHESADEYHAHARHHLSSHQLADFRKCPQLYYRKKTQPPTRDESPAYLVGRAAYVLILEGFHSSAGKDWPRKLNTRILFEIGAAGCLGERFSSGEGIQDALYLSPSMLFQTDEIDGMLQSMSKSRDGRHENLMSTLLTMYSSANSVYPMRRKAGKESPGSIDQPCLVVCLRLIRKLQEIPERQLPHSLLLKRMKMDAKSFQEMIATLERQGDIATSIVATSGRPQRLYKLLRPQ
jgi:hypothetical protein